MTLTGPFDVDLDRRQANFTPLTPLSFLRRTAALYPEKTAIIHGGNRWTYKEFEDRCLRLAGALSRLGVGPGDTVSVLLPNIPAMLECHHGVPMCGAVLNAINYRLDGATIAFILAHGASKVLIFDREYDPEVADALKLIDRPLELIAVDDPEYLQVGDPPTVAAADYDALVAAGAAWTEPEGGIVTDEWAPLALNYTSGTTGNPKGVVYSHRGACLNAYAGILATGLARDSVYLWTLPMFHCNGWCFTWAVTAAGATHVCLRKVEPAAVFDAVSDFGVTTLCGAPIVLTMLVHAPEDLHRDFAQACDVFTGGAAPSSTVISAMQRLGFRVSHLYGLTETYGPSLMSAEQENWASLALEERAGLMARQGVTYPLIEETMVADPETGQECPWDGHTLGEVMLRGNTVMKGYLANPEATEAAFRDGWFHTGDLAVRHPDGYIEVKDRAKDVIISGGENISSLEVEEVLYRHPAVMEAAVVARPDETWGETPCAFVTLKPDAQTVEAEVIMDFCRANMARFKVPRTVVFGALPKTSTGKIQKYELRKRAENL